MTARKKNRLGYEDVLDRVLEDPKDQMEEDYARLEAESEAERIWSKMDKSPNYRARVIKRLALELLDTMPKPKLEQAEDETATSEQDNVL